MIFNIMRKYHRAHKYNIYDKKKGKKYSGEKYRFLYNYIAYTDIFFKRTCHAYFVESRTSLINDPEILLTV